MTAPTDKTLDDLVRRVAMEPLYHANGEQSDICESLADVIAALRERIAALTERSKLDPLSHAWKSGYAQATEEMMLRIAALEAELKLAVGMLDVALAERNRCREELGLLQKDSVSIFEWLNRKGGLGLDVHRRIDTFLATWRKQ